MFRWASIIIYLLLFTLSVFAQEVTELNASDTPNDTPEVKRPYGEKKVDELGSGESLSIEEYQEFMKRYCRINQTSPHCADLTNFGKKKIDKDIVDPCSIDPFSKRCQSIQKDKMKLLIDVQKACQKDPNSKSCQAAKKKANRNR